MGLKIGGGVRVLLKAGPRPSGLRSTARDGPAARRPEGPSARGPRPRRPGGPAARRPGGPVLIFQFFCPAVNPRACTALHWVRARKMDDGEFEFVYHLII